MLYLVGDSQCAQNIQIYEVIGENVKCVFYFMKKPVRLFGQPNKIAPVIQSHITHTLSVRLAALLVTVSHCPKGRAEGVKCFSWTGIIAL